MRRLILSIGTLTVFVAGLDVRAIERGPLPEVALTRVDGSADTTGGAAMAGAWLLLYVQADCAACDVVLEATKGGGVAGRVAVVVAGASPADLRRLASRYDHLPAAAWFADPGRAVLTQLRLPGVPIVIGVRDRTVEWSLAGVITSAATVRSVLESWTAR